MDEGTVVSGRALAVMMAALIIGIGITVMVTKSDASLKRKRDELRERFSIASAEYSTALANLIAYEARMGGGA